MAINLTGLRSSSMNINSMWLYGAIFTTMQDASSTVNSIAFSIRPDTDEVRFLYFDFRDTEGITTITLTYSTGESFTLAPFPVGTKTRYRIDLRSPDGKAKFSGIQDISVNISFNDGLAGVAANYLFNGIFLDNDPFSFELEDNRTTVDNDTVLPASGWAYLKKQVRFSSPSKYAFVFGPSAEATEDQARMFYAVRADMDKIKYLLFNVKSVPDVYNIYLLDYSSSEPILLYDVNDEDSLFGYAGEEGLFAVELSRYVDWKGVKDFIIVITCDDLTRQQDFEFEYIALTTSAKAPAIDDEELLPEEVDTGDPFAMAAVPAILAIGGLVALVLTKARKRRLNSR